MKIGIQLYSVRNTMAENPAQGLRKVAKAGYKYIEAANHNTMEDIGLGFGISAEETNAIQQECGINIFSAHVGPLTNENVPQIAKFYQAIGAKYIGIGIDFFKDASEVEKKAKQYNEFGKVFNDYGLGFVYHNHFQEFQDMGGKTVMDIIAENTNPDYVGIELDTYWVMRSGIAPVEALKKFGSRIKMVHQKDMPSGYEHDMNLLEKAEKLYDEITMEVFAELKDSDQFIEIGAGIMDIQEIINAANEFTSAEYLILEQDNTKLDEMESIKVSYNNFSKYKGVEL